MSRKLYISNSFNVNTLDDAASYFVEWTDINGTTTNIPCDSSGVGKVVPDGSGDAAWITAHLYRRVGDGVAELFAVPKIIMRAYKINGQEITSGVGGYPSTKYNSSFFTIQKYDYTWGERAKYVVEFYDASNNILVTSAICRNLDGVNGDDGVSAPRYTEEFYAWSDKPSTSGVGEQPSPNSGWQDYIAPQGSYAYLWKKIVLYVYNSTTHQYDASQPQYYRMNGENGTSIRTKGSARAVIKYWANSISDLPTSGVDGGTLAWVEGDSFLMEYHEGSTGWWAQSIRLVENDLIIHITRNAVYSFDGIDDLVVETVATDGDSYTNQVDGHLWQYSMEASRWLDLGQFKG